MAMGRTHISLTVLTGSTSLYGLHYVLLHPDSQFDWVNRFATWFTSTIDLPFMSDRVGKGEFVFFLILFLVTLAFGSLVPDIDKNNSILGRYVPFIEDAIGHRTFLHSIWVVLLFAGFAFMMSSFWFSLFTIAYLCHLIQDSFSLSGIDWFYPIKLKKKKFKLLRYRVNGMFETIVFGLSILVNAFFLFKWVQVVL